MPGVSVDGTMISIGGVGCATVLPVARRDRVVDRPSRGGAEAQKPDAQSLSAPVGALSDPAHFADGLNRAGAQLEVEVDLRTDRDELAGDEEEPGSGEVEHAADQAFARPATAEGGIALDAGPLPA